MCNLGVMYRKGEGGVQDDAKAREWIQKAADAGNENAKKMLKELPNVDRSKSQAATPQISRTLQPARQTLCTKWA
jgi:TPR repeat protein